MNMLVSAAAVVAATPVIAEAALGGMDHSAVLARAEQVVSLLRDHVVRDGWKMDEQGAAAMLAYFRRRAAGAPEDDDAEGAAIEWVRDHGQSLDWILCGDPGVMICRAAKTSTVAHKSAAASDPVFAAIEDHRKALAAFEAAVREHGDLDEILPAEKTKTSSYAGEITIVETDDPRWIASVRLVDELSDREVKAACELVDVLPTTPLGIVALLQYANAYVEAGQVWPDDLVDDPDDPNSKGRDWFYFLARNVADVLSKAA